MILTLSLAFVLLPQEPSPAQRLRDVHHDVVAEKDVTVVEKGLVETPDGTFPGIPTPRVVRDLREAGVGALDLAGHVLDVSDQDEAVDTAFALVHRAWDFRARVEPAPERPDLREFERVCSHAWRDLIQALGSGRDLTKVAPELHAAVDQVRRNVENLGDLSREERELLRTRLERLQRVEQEKVHALAERIVRTALALDRDDFKAAMRREPVKAGRSDGAVQGDVLLDRDTAFGRMVVGGFERNVYDCTQIDVILDLGGDDEYRGPAGGAGSLRRLGVVVDLEGDDVYDAGNDGLGSGTFGIGVLVDLRGDDGYKSLSRSAGFGLGGAGILLDAAGDDRYELGDQSGGVGLAGTGLFLDLAGNDLQTAGVQSLGCGLPGGVGLLLDLAGNDVRRLGVERKLVAEAKDADATQTTDRDTPRLQEVSVGLGAGVGVLPLMSGGFGAVLDLQGKDEYRAGGLAMGAGIRGGAGVLRDVAGDDVYVAGDVALGAAYAHGLGVMRDEAGADRYEAGHLALGAGSAHGIGLALDVAGDDAYAAIVPSLGGAQRTAVGGFVDLAGKDEFEMRRGAASWRVLAVEEQPGTAIGVFLHLGGAEDVYRFDRVPTPENERMRVVEGGDEQFPERHFYIDR